MTVVTKSDPTHCYLGVKPCGCFGFIGVDDPDLADELADDVRHIISTGGRVDRLLIEDGRQVVGGLPSSCVACARTPAQEVDRG